MGRVAEFFREQSITLDGQKKVKMLSLDRQFQDMEAERDSLKTENLSLKAQVNPLQREVDRLKNQVEQNKPKAHSLLNTVTVDLLKLIANNPNFVVPNLFDHMGLTQLELDYHLDILKEQKLISLSSVSTRGARYHATPLGRKYLMETPKDRI